MSSRRTLSILLAAVLLTVTACSSDDGGSDAAADDPAAEAGGASGPEEGGGTGSGGSGDESERSASDDDENPLVLGYEVDGPSGTTVSVVATVVAQDQEQPPMSATWSITDRPRWQLFSNWVESGELELEVTEGGPATVTVIRATYVDPNDPFAGIDVEEELGEVEVTAGEPATLDLS